VKEQVFIAPGVDKSKASVREPLDGAFCHGPIPQKKVRCSVAGKHSVQAAPLQTGHSIGSIGCNQLAAGDGTCQRRIPFCECWGCAAILRRSMREGANREGINSLLRNPGN
jgi:hypothetical protein